MKVQITELDRKSFIQGVYYPYIQSVKHLEKDEEKDPSMYESEQLNTLTSFYGIRPQL